MLAHAHALGEQVALDDKAVSRSPSPSWSASWWGPTARGGGRGLQGGGHKQEWDSAGAPRAG